MLLQGTAEAGSLQAQAEGLHAPVGGLQAGAHLLLLLQQLHCACAALLLWPAAAAVPVMPSEKHASAAAWLLLWTCAWHTADLGHTPGSAAGTAAAAATRLCPTGCAAFVLGEGIGQLQQRFQRSRNRLERPAI